jgi:hypothetical protein
MTALLAVILSLQTQEARAKAEEVLTIADRFLTACSNDDAVELKQTTAFPFFVFAPCKGGDFDDLEDLRNRFVNRISQRPVPPLPKGMKRVVLSPQAFFQATFPTASEVDMRIHLKRYGDTRVVCLIHESGETSFGLAVFIRAEKSGQKAVAFTYVVPGTIRP